MPTVTVYSEPEDFPDGEEYEFISFINAETHGIPALLAGRAGGTIEAEKGQKILYVNTSLVPLLEVEK